MATVFSFYHVVEVLLFLLLHINLSGQEKILGETTDEFDFDGLPGAQHEFKIDVGAGKEECFFQKAAKGAILHISYEVVRGGDRTIDVFLKNPQLHIREAINSKTDGVFEFTIDEEGAYSICIDNTFSRFSSKLVFVYMVTYITQDWETYMEEIEQVHGTVANFSTSLGEVASSLTETLSYQAESRMHIIKDWYRVKANNYYVQAWSIFQCSITIVTSCFQVYFVRRLFRTVNITPTSKPRA